MKTNRTLFIGLAVANLAAFACFLFLHLSLEYLNDDQPPVVTLHDTDYYSTNSTRSLFLLGQTSLVQEWNETAIFNGDTAFITLGLPEKSSFFDKVTFKHLTHQPTIWICRHDNCWRSIDFSQINHSLPDFSHLFVHFEDKKRQGFSLLIAQLFEVTASYYYCHGLPKLFVKRRTFNHSSTCPPCICASVFERQTLNRYVDVSLMAKDASDLFFNKTIYEETKLANHLFKNSRFVSCSRHNATAIRNVRDDVFLDGGSVQFQARHAWAVRELFRLNGMPTVLEGGTLLGWYRDCSIIPQDIDMDLMVPSWALNKKFYETLIQNAYIKQQPSNFKISSPTTGDMFLRTSRIFGDLQTGVEVRFDVRRYSETDYKAVGVDVFIMFLDENEQRSDNYVLGFYTNDRQMLHYDIPKNASKLCSTIFLGHLYLVPCNPAIYLENNYGKDWRIPQPRSETYWWQQPNIKRRITLNPAEWRRRVMFKSFENRHSLLYIWS